MTLPIIRLEVEGMKHSIIHAFNDLQLHTDEYLQASLNKFCESKNLQRLIDQTVNRVVEEAMKEEVEQFFRYGKGRSVIAKAVAKKLEQETQL